MQIKTILSSENAKLPNIANYGDAGADMTATKVTWNKEYGFYDISTEVACQIPHGYVGFIFPRSSLSKYDLILCNHVGVFDSGYRGTVSFRFKLAKSNSIIHKTLRKIGLIKPLRIYKEGDRIGQLVIIKHESPTYIESNDLSETKRGERGFGSTGA